MRNDRLAVSVILCCYTEQRMRDILEAVTSVLRQAPLPDEVLLVVDNNQTLHAGLREQVGQSALVILHEGPYGISATRNRGVELARGDVVVFLDDDAVAEPEWLHRLTEPFKDPDVVVVGGRAVLRWAKIRPPWFPEELDWAVGGSPIWFPAERAVVRNPHGFNMCFRRNVFRAVGGFASEVGGIREIPRSGEEADLCLRIRQRWPTAKVVWEPAAVVVHKVPENKVRFPVVIRRAYNEGLYKSWIRQVSPKNGNDHPLSTEHAYLKYVLSRAFPSRLTSLWQPQGLLQAAALVLCIAAAGMGYAIGTMKNTHSSRPSRQS